MDNEQAKLNAIVNDIADIKTGNFTPPLPFPEDDPNTVTRPGVDAGALKPLNALGLKSTLIAKIGKKLAKTETDVVTVGHLEELQRSKPMFWMKDLGLKTDQTTLVQDAMEAFRKANPMPSPDDKLTVKCVSAKNEDGTQNEELRDEINRKLNGADETIADKIGKLTPTPAKA